LSSGSCNMFGGLGSQGMSGFWWSSSPYSSSTDRASCLFVNSSDVILPYAYRDSGYAVRCQRD
jgi:hypothetical protein